MDLYDTDLYDIDLYDIDRYDIDRYYTWLLARCQEWVLCFCEVLIRL